MENIKEFYLNPTQFDKWSHQNDIEYTGDFVDGVLLDNFVVFTKHGVAAIYEHYVNCWQSDYRVEFLRCHKNDEPGWTQAIFNRWYAFEGSCYEEEIEVGKVNE